MIFKLRYVFFSFLLAACGTVNLPFSGGIPGATPTTCPQIGIVSDARHITLFSNPDKPTSNNVRASAVIDDFDGGCNYEDGKVFVDLDLVLNVSLGAKSRVRDKDKPTITVPYFVAIEAPDGEILGKEVFAGAIKFGPEENSKSQVERLRQVIPLEDLFTGRSYKIYTGFQLTQSQLEYNRSNKFALEVKGEDPRPKF